jgi:hypothetical protein
MILNIDNSISQFVVYIGSKNNYATNEQLIKPKIKDFFAAQKITSYEELEHDAHISDIDFKEIDFSYFYTNVFNGIQKTNSKILFTTKYCITIDKNNCKKTCPITKINFDTIFINETPILFFIYINVDEIISFLRSQPPQKITPKQS